MEAGKRNIESIFNNGRVLEIPFFQRSYVWEEGDWERFLNDMSVVSTAKGNYFLGSIILKSKTVSSENQIGDWRVVVDGQQRLTTIVLFFKALCAVHSNHELFISTFYNRKKEIILKHNHNDIETFEAIVGGGAEALADNNNNSSVLKCYNFFSSKHEELGAIDPNKILDKIYFVGIDLGKDEDEQQIFDTINSLGVSLTTAELLKNEFYRREDEELYNETWKNVFEADSDAREYWDQRVTAGRQYRANIDLLLQSYLLISSGAKEKYIGLDNLFKSYKSYLSDSKISTDTFIEELIDYAQLYQDNIRPSLLNEDIDRGMAIERLNIVIFGLNITTVVPYVLFILKNVPEMDEQTKIFNLLEAYLIRRVICKETSKNYNNLFASCIRNSINTFELLHTKIIESEDPSSRMPDDNMLKHGFLESNLTNQQAKTILYLIEKSIRGKKDATSLLSLNEYSLEHVMPKKWRNNWPNCQNDEESRVRDQKLLKLGNLTVITLSLNISIRDANWADKVNGRNNKLGLREYSTGIKIFEKNLNAGLWDEDSINKRSLELFEYASGIWSSALPKELSMI